MTTPCFRPRSIDKLSAFQATSIYDSCVEERDTLLALNKTSNLPVCDLQKELENVNTMKSVKWLALCCSMLIVTMCMCYRTALCTTGWFSMFTISLVTIIDSL